MLDKNYINNINARGKRIESVIEESWGEAIDRNIYPDQAAAETHRDGIQRAIAYVGGV